MWPEVEKAKNEHRRELALTGKEISKRINEDGLDRAIFELTNLNYLNISETTLSELPDKLGSLQNLQTLLLHSNKLEKINEAISSLEKLKILDLSQNCIETAPECLDSLTQLVTLNLSGNKLESFPCLTKTTKLTVLDLSNNKLKSFSNICSENFGNLSELKLSHNEIEEIPVTISNLNQLKMLDLNTNKITSIPGELVDCQKLKEVNLKSNPVSDRRLLKLIDQCRTKQIVDYVKQHCPKTTILEKKAKDKKNTKKCSDDEEDDDSHVEYKHSINVTSYDNSFKIVINDSVANIRDHIAACIVNGVNFSEDTFKKFIQLQNKLHDTVCEKRNFATIATHDFNKLPPGNLVYTTSPPNELVIKPLNKNGMVTGAELFGKLQTEANNLRKEKKRNVYSGIHKYLYLIEGKVQYPCLLNGNNEVISFPPLTNSDISKIDVNTTKIFVEVTSSISQHACKKVLDTLLREMVVILDKDLDIQQVRTEDQNGQTKVVYPSKTDLNFEKGVHIKVHRH
ncbi:unnamed protein product [Acanthoscelides obtectus]|uniref:B3/B4 tRNA-binding domain-containing protein n=1 Tax=Acanthoscelides obtectus TaxID=200917 RepID=A0A9P0PE34_ACAOB|nr:unnamed protein product [Acanthoscelides obtectus]CAK1645660.1 Leucine-rich repeat-containing protein 47 [Acanthoscelides obtectus]